MQPEEAERLEAERAAEEACQQAEQQAILMREMGTVARLSKRVETEELEEEDADKACWNCRSQNISCKKIR